MSSGAKVVTAYAVQANVATTPNTGWKILPNRSNGLTVSTELTDSEILSGGRMKKSGMVTGASVSGDIETELMFGAFDDLMAGAMFGSWKAGSQPTIKTLEIGDTKTMFAITKDFTDIGVYHLFKGCVVNTMDISVSTGNICSISFGLMGLGYEHSKTASFARSPAQTPDTAKASSISIGTILHNGADIGVCVEEIKFSVDNQAEVQKCLGDNMYGGNILALLASISGSLKIAYSAKAHDMLVTQLTGATLSLEFPIQFATDKKYAIKIPKMQINGEIPSPSGTKLAVADLNFTVVDVSPVIEKHGA